MLDDTSQLLNFSSLSVTLTIVDTRSTARAAMTNLDPGTVLLVNRSGDTQCLGYSLFIPYQMHLRYKYTIENLLE